MEIHQVRKQYCPSQLRAPRHHPVQPDPSTVFLIESGWNAARLMRDAFVLVT